MIQLLNDGEDNGKCELLGPFGLFVQALMAVLTMGSLVWKRYHERPHRRPWRIWMYDVSKQVIGASFVHITNLFLSIISKIRLHVFTVKGNPKRICDNPCDYYFLNLLVDTTIGIPILYFFIVGITGVLKGMHIHGLNSGEYGDPPLLSNYAKQLVVYLVSLGLTKLSVYVLMLSFPILVRVAIWMLSRLDPYPNVQVGFVLLVFPLIMNVFQCYVVDNLIQSSVYHSSNKDTLLGDVEEGLPEHYGSAGSNDCVE